MSERLYPLPQPESGEDSRFTFGLFVDVREVLIKHGYPALTGPDMVELGQVLFRFLYDTDNAAGGVS